MITWPSLKTSVHKNKSMQHNTLESGTAASNVTPEGTQKNVRARLEYRKTISARMKRDRSYFDIVRFPCRFADKTQRPSTDICDDRKLLQTRHESCPVPNFDEALSCRKVVRTFTTKLDLLMREEKKLTSERPLSWHAFVGDAIFV